MSTLFLAFTAVLALCIAIGAVRYLPGNHRFPALAGLAVWLSYAAWLGYAGIIADTTLRPPGLFYLMAPIVAMVMFTANSRAGAAIALSVPIHVAIAFQVFRAVVELFLHALWDEGLLPRTMTFHGANFDIVIGATAPLVAWAWTRGWLSDRLALTWNVAGIAMLANVALRGVLSAPGPLRFITADVPNTAIGIFPYSFIPGLMVPTALLLHVIAVRALRARMRSVRTLAVSPTPARTPPSRQ